MIEKLLDFWRHLKRKDPAFRMQLYSIEPSWFLLPESSEEIKNKMLGWPSDTVRPSNHKTDAETVFYANKLYLYTNEKNDHLIRYLILISEINFRTGL